MPDVCDFSGVAPAGCAHCRQIPDATALLPAGGNSATFRARFDSTCAGCDFDVRAGQHVRYADDRLVHAGCADA